MKPLLYSLLAIFLILPDTFAASVIKVKKDDNWPDLKVAIDENWPDCKIKFDDNWADVHIVEDDNWPDIKVKRDQNWPDIKVKQDQNWPDVVVSGTTDLILAAAACAQAKKPAPPAPQPAPVDPFPSQPTRPTPERSWEFCGFGTECATTPLACIMKSNQKSFALKCVSGSISAVYVAKAADTRALKGKDFSMTVTIDENTAYFLGKSIKKAGKENDLVKYTASSQVKDSLLTSLMRGTSMTMTFKDSATGKPLLRETFTLKGSASTIRSLDSECR